MPRRNTERRRARGSAAPGWTPTVPGRTDTGPDGEQWNVRDIASARAVKTYRCPGCDHEVRPGVAHVVAWPRDEHGGAEERRHWHDGCWAGRRSRGITRRWS